MLDEGIVLLGSTFCQWLEPVGVVGYAIVPKELKAKTLTGEEVALNPIWDRRQCTKFNGTSYISQRAAEAIYTPEGKEQVKATINYYMENAHFMIRLPN